MRQIGYKIAVGIFACTCWLALTGYAQGNFEEQHRMVAFRMVGHKILLNAGDSTSLVLPVEKEDDRYRIRFGTDFGFIPEDLVSTVNHVVSDAGIGDGHIVEVVACETGEVVYSYRRNATDQKDIIPCKSRALPESCYQLYITMLEEKQPLFKWHKAALDTPDPPASGGRPAITFMLLLFLVLAGTLYYLRHKRHQSTADPDVFRLGAYQFNNRTSELLIADQRIELTGKESELLLLLYKAVNTTVEREVILETVWGDDGDYVGRTLDVFISKLRKKLDADSSVRILNTRGIGYKLVVDMP